MKTAFLRYSQLDGVSQNTTVSIARKWCICRRNATLIRYAKFKLRVFECHIPWMGRYGEPHHTSARAWPRVLFTAYVQTYRCEKCEAVQCKSVTASPTEETWPPIFFIAGEAWASRELCVRTWRQASTYALKSIFADYPLPQQQVPNYSPVH